ncbi:Sucrase/ferredoxin-like-domain-containing protein [Syncephalastrum racemosum]|uniref:Sucrase/ferredoxin-like-domain-containing protein n=1 Tax=Syncephalastrum racemosum TaxID=13706 RepID=A0A1X2HPT6_SYNRA|nr:Sucrase/ferredoxin-like-domain-containing protein [Syncephalastrum racemosum]
MLRSAVPRIRRLPIQRILAVRQSHSAIPFDTEPFPLERFEPCCPGEANRTFENGYVPCKNHPLPNVIGGKVDFADPFPQRPPSARHIVACIGHGAPEWNRAKVEAVKGGYVQSTELAKNDFLKQNRNVESSPFDLLTTVCERPPESKAKPDIIVFPDFKRYPAVDPTALTQSPFYSVLESLWKEPKSTTLPDIPCEELDVDTIVLVCTHTMRDKRCGILGPLLVDEFRRVFEERGLKKAEVWGTSHFGGHKFAGNVIIHQKGLGGQMYGNLRQCHVESVVDRHIINRKVIRSLWRGSVTPATL